MSSNIEKKLIKIEKDISNIKKINSEDLLYNIIDERLTEILLQYNDSLSDALYRLEDKNKIKLLKRL